jgi:hypothetical protein
VNLDLSRSGSEHKRHGAFVKPGYRGVGVASGIGDYREWLESEAELANKEARQERQERFTPQVEPLQPLVIEDAEPEEQQPDWELTWIDRQRIGWQVEDVTPRLSGEDFWDWNERQLEACRCTELARSFENWVEAGCPLSTKGKR